MSTRVLVTGGSGFIGSALVLRLAAQGCIVTNIDKMTYAANPASLASLQGAPNYTHIQADITDAPAMAAALQDAQPDVIFHLAAESHVDRSIDRPAEFIQTNVVGTCTLLDAALAHWRALPAPAQAQFRFLHISTDEVFGALGAEGHFTEASPYRPNSPYSASKAASDHMARVWGTNFGLPVIITNCSNNYGPRQHPEKFIPKCITNGLTGAPIPIYADGTNVRDWLHVEDHVDGLLAAWMRGQPGETYAFGGGAAGERTNISLAQQITALLDEKQPPGSGQPHATLLTFVKDRPMHDFRYAIEAVKARAHLAWTPTRDLEAGLSSTIDWYIAHPDWWRATVSAAAGA